jgi:hypothetical protein
MTIWWEISLDNLYTNIITLTFLLYDTVFNFEIVVICQSGVMRITYVTAARGVAQLRMDMETDVKTEIAFQDVSCKKKLIQL